MAMLPIRTILHPTDFSECSRAAFHLASKLAQAEGARLVILHVKQELGPMVAYGEALDQLVPAEYEEKLQEVLHWFQVPDPRVRVEHQIARGNAAQEILRMAREINCDLIVMGTHGRTGVDHLVLGSVAEQIQRRSPCAVVTVSTGHREATGSRAAKLRPATEASADAR
jgi:nucleotide-binding universal stress UspA family protein